MSQYGRRRVITCAFLLVLLTGPALASTGLSTHEGRVQQSVAVLYTAESDTRLTTHTVAFRSGPWGTDFVGVAHALGNGAEYSLTIGGQPSRSAWPVLVCAASGFDVALFRTRSLVEPARFAEAGLTLSEGELLTIVPSAALARSFPHVRAKVAPAWRWPAHLGDPRGILLMEVTRPVRPGYSGSPVVDGQGRIVGLVTAVVKGTNLAVAIPIERISICLSRDSRLR